MDAINYAVIQSGYAVFGVGSTGNEAIEDAARWMDDTTVEEIKGMLVNPRNAADGDLYLADTSHPEFNDYMKAQGGFVQRDGLWYDD